MQTKRAITARSLRLDGGWRDAFPRFLSLGCQFRGSRGGKRPGGSSRLCMCVGGGVVPGQGSFKQMVGDYHVNANTQLRRGCHLLSCLLAGGSVS